MIARMQNGVKLVALLILVLAALLHDHGKAFGKVSWSSH